MNRVFCYVPGILAKVVLAGGLVISSISVQGSDFTYQFNTVFSSTGGNSSPAGPSPWLTAELQDVTPGKVNLTITTGGLQGSEFVSDFFLNLDPTLASTSLSFAQTSKTGSFTNPSIGTGANAFKADGDGYYDVDLGFDTSNGNTFTVGDAVTYQITGISGLDANDFVFTSQMGGGAGTWLAAAHVQSIGSDGSSAWIAPTQLTAVPEPNPAMLIFTMAAGMVLVRLRRRNAIERA